MKKLEKNVIESAKIELKNIEIALSAKKRKKVSTKHLSWILSDIYEKYEKLESTQDIIDKWKGYLGNFKAFAIFLAKYSPVYIPIIIILFSDSPFEGFLDYLKNKFS